MATFREDQIGSRIKSLRIDRGLTLAQVSDQTSFSCSYLSKLENSQSAPPVSTLSSIAEALGVHIADIFSESKNETLVTLVRKEQRQPSYRHGAKAGYSYIPLAPVFPKRLMDPYVIVIQPDIEKKQIFQHKGQELVVILSGKLQVYYGQEEFTLRPGDCLYFDASIPHYGFALDDQAVEFLMVMSSGAEQGS